MLTARSHVDGAHPGTTWRAQQSEAYVAAPPPANPHPFRISHPVDKMGVPLLERAFWSVIVLWGWGREESKSPIPWLCWLRKSGDLPATWEISSVWSWWWGGLWQCWLIGDSSVFLPGREFDPNKVLADLVVLPNSLCTLSSHLCRHVSALLAHQKRLSLQLCLSCYVSGQHTFIWVLYDWAEIPPQLLCMHMDNGFLQGWGKSWVTFFFHKVATAIK